MSNLRSVSFFSDNIILLNLDNEYEYTRFITYLMRCDYEVMQYKYNLRMLSSISKCYIYHIRI